MEREVHYLLHDVAPPVEVATEQLAVGQRVKARFGASSFGSSGTHWYSGTITQVHQDGRCDVQYDDGDQEVQVLPKYVKVQPVHNSLKRGSSNGTPSRKRHKFEEAGDTSALGADASTRQDTATTVQLSADGANVGEGEPSGASVRELDHATKTMRQEHVCIPHSRPALGPAPSESAGLIVVEQEGKVSPVEATDETTLHDPRPRAGLVHTLRENLHSIAGQSWSIATSTDVARARRAARATGWMPVLEASGAHRSEEGLSLQVTEKLHRDYYGTEDDATHEQSDDLGRRLAQARADVAVTKTTVSSKSSTLSICPAGYGTAKDAESGAEGEVPAGSDGVKDCPSEKNVDEFALWRHLLSVAPLPCGWLQVRHQSGAPCWIHLASRVSCASRPILLPVDIPLTTTSILKATLPPFAEHALSHIDNDGGYVVDNASMTVSHSQAAVREPATTSPAESRSNRREYLPRQMTWMMPNDDDHVDMPEWIVDGKSPLAILSEFCSKAMCCGVELVVTTQQDPVNPFMASVVAEGVIVARGASTTKKASKQVAAREAMRILCPHLIQPTDADKGSKGAPGCQRPVVEQNNGAFAKLEKLEIDTLRLKLTDDRILEAQVGKTPVMVLQEHCHKHVGKLPEYATTDVIGASAYAPLHRVRVQVGNRHASAVNTLKKKAKQAAALEMLRKIYPHVNTWGELVESTNSRQREEKIERARQLRLVNFGQRAVAMDAITSQSQQPACGAFPTRGASIADVHSVVTASVGTVTATTTGCWGQPLQANTWINDAVSTFHIPDQQWRATYHSLLQEIGVKERMLQQVYDTLWDQIAFNNAEATANCICLRPKPHLRGTMK